VNEDKMDVKCVCPTNAETVDNDKIGDQSKKFHKHCCCLFGDTRPSPRLHVNLTPPLDRPQPST